MRSKLKWIFTLIVACAMQFSYAQEKTITGIVTDASGPVPGVNVFIKGTRTGTSTNFDGSYSIKTKVGETLVFTFLGMKELSILVESSNVINPRMSADNPRQLIEVVIVAQGKSKEKKSLGYDQTTLKSASLENRPQSDVVRSIQGKIAGVQITNTGGLAGSTSNIVLRGNKTINGTSQPLFIVDGVPFDVSASDATGSFNQGAAASSSRFLDIDPNNIESFSVLKGLAASVTYGSQGRNGVILITTKKGKKSEKINVAYSSTTFVSEIANLPDYQNKYGAGSQNLTLSSAASIGVLGSWGSPFDGSSFVSIYDQAYITSAFPEYIGAKAPWEAKPNNVKDFFRKGVSNVNSLNLSGGTDKIQYSVNTSYTDEDGIVKNNNLNKYNIGFNISAKLTDKFRFAGGVTYYKTKYSTPPVAASTGAGAISIFERLMFIPRSLDLQNLPNQNPITGASIYYRTDLENPLWLLENSRSIQNVNRITGRLEGTYSFSKYVDLTYRFGLDRYVDNQRVYTNKGGTEAIYINGYMRTTSSTNTILNQDLILDLKPIGLTETIKLNGSLGFNSRRDESSQFGTSSQNQTLFGKTDHSFFANQSNTDPFAGDLDIPTAWTNILGVYAIADLSYKDYLYVNFQARNDFGSQLEARNQSVFYPSASVAFIPTEALTSIKSDVLNYWKLRAAYGTSAGFPRFLYNTRSFNTFNATVFSTDGVITPGVSALAGLGNPDLKPELHKEIEIGTDLEMFQTRVKLSLSAYKRISEDQIVSKPLDPSTGYTSTTINAGRIDNKGVEVNLSLVPVKTDNFSWTVTSLFTKNVSKVVSLPQGQDRINISGFANSIGTFAIQGEPYGVLVGSYAVKDSNGNYLIDQGTGKVLVSTALGLPNKIIGNPNPDFTTSLNNTFSYKGFNFDFLIEYVKGGDFFSSTINNLLSRGVTRDTENREGTFVIPGVYANPTNGALLLDANNNTIPNTQQLSLNDVYFNNLLNPDSQNVYDGTRLRLREVSLGYTFPSKLLNGSFISGLSFNFIASNLWLKAFNIPKYTNIDPELISTGTGNGLGIDFQTAPQSKRYGFSVKVNF